MFTIRSMLFVPADQPERIAKALGSFADTVTVDLEDGVAPDHKDLARRTALRVLPAADRTGVLLRINGNQSPWQEQDLEVVTMLLPLLAAVVVPKVESAAEVHALAEVLLHAEEAAGLPIGGVKIVPICESARGVLAATEIAAASERVWALVFGPLDLGTQLGVQPTVEGREFLHARSQLVLASAAAGLQGPVDGPHADLFDDDGLRRSTVASRDLGFSGRVVLHPRQLAVVQPLFVPSDDEIHWARTVIAASERASAAGLGAVRTAEGAFIDRPVVLRAERILERIEQGVRG